MAEPAGRKVCKRGSGLPTGGVRCESVPRAGGGRIIANKPWREGHAGKTATKLFHGQKKGKG